LRSKGSECNLEKYPACWKQYENGVCVLEAVDPMALVEAVLAQDEDQVNALKQAKRHDINIKDIHGNTALHREALEGNLEAVKLLLEAGSDLNLEGKYNETALDFAIFRGHKECAFYLDSVGACANH